MEGLIFIRNQRISLSILQEGTRFIHYYISEDLIGFL